MTDDLLVQLRSYGDALGANLPDTNLDSVIAADVIEASAASARRLPSDGAGDSLLLPRPETQVLAPVVVVRRRGVWAATAAVVIAVLIGGVAWISQGSPGDEVIDQPNVSTPPTTTTTPSTTSNSTTIPGVLPKPNVVIPDAWVLKDRSSPSEVFPVSSALYGIVASDTLLVAVGTDSVICCGSGVDGDPSSDASAAVWTSLDSVNWVRVPHDESVFGGPNGQAMYR
ncbi:MAG: hypothetical protein ACR2NL_08340, partial [Acidimicrobiia bacterium]